MQTMKSGVCDVQSAVLERTLAFDCKQCMHMVRIRQKKEDGAGF